jgi:glucose/arabinose dehydrogenase
VGDHALRLPAGFSVSLLASGLAQPRFMLFDPAGNLLVADMAGRVYRFAPTDLPGSSAPAPLIAGLDAPSNVAFHDGFLYVGETGAISRYAYDPASGTLGGREVVVPDLPRGGHSTRTVVFGSEGEMYVSVGSSCNICEERDPRRAAISRFAADGSGGQVFASGLRNAVGLAIQPGSGLLWATTNERDNQGNEIPPDLVTVVRGGENFGWPACQPPYAAPQDPGAACSGITPPTVGIQAHSAPLGLAFYTGQSFPPDYAGDLFVAQHGSWNRTPPAQPKLLRVHFDGGVPTTVQDFATGWQDGSGNRWGRPVGVAVAPDGSLVVSDDQSGVLYRISYAG